MRRFSARVRLPNGRGSWKLRARPSRVRWCAVSPVQRRPGEAHAALLVAQGAADAVDQGRLARAVGPDQAEPLARLDLEVDLLQRGEAAEALAEARRRGAARSSLPPWNRPTIPCGAAITKPTIRTPATSTLTADEMVTRDMLQAADQHRADHRPQPAGGAADQRHGDGVDRVVQAEAGRGVEIGHVIRQRRARHAHEAAGQRRGDQLQPQRSARPTPRPPPRRRGWRRSRSPAPSARWRAPSPAR